MNSSPLRWLRPLLFKGERIAAGAEHSRAVGATSAVMAWPCSPNMPFGAYMNLPGRAIASREYHIPPTIFSGRATVLGQSILGPGYGAGAAHSRAWLRCWGSPFSGRATVLGQLILGPGYGAGAARSRAGLRCWGSPFSGRATVLGQLILGPGYGALGPVSPLSGFWGKVCRKGVRTACRFLPCPSAAARRAVGPQPITDETRFREIGAIQTQVLICV